MKTKLLALLILSVVAAFGEEPERIVVVRDSNVGSVQRLLSEGWTVKHQSASIAVTTNDYNQMTTEVLIVFTLTPPSPERLAEAEAKRKAEFEKKRSEFLKSRQVEKSP